jgi:hypothetical protein
MVLVLHGKGLGGWAWLEMASDRGGVKNRAATVKRMSARWRRGIYSVRGTLETASAHRRQAGSSCVAAQRCPLFFAFSFQAAFNPNSLSKLHPNSVISF